MAGKPYDMVEFGILEPEYRSLEGGEITETETISSNTNKIQYDENFYLTAHSASLLWFK